MIHVMGRREGGEKSEGKNDRLEDRSQDLIRKCC